MAETSRNCELCSDKATFYCPSDSAFLCSSCDAKVHNANFLVARHVRSSICPSCRNLGGNIISGVNTSPETRHPCRNCSPENFKGAGEIEIDINDSHSSSSSCVSSTTEPGEEVVSVSSSSRKTRRERISGGVAPVVVDRRVEGVLVNWCRRLGVEEKKSSQVVAMAVDLVGGCLSRMTVLPFRVSLATALWVALRLCGGGEGSRTCQAQELRRVEQISGVPGKLILATEARLARVINHRRSRENHEEGWAEC